MKEATMLYRAPGADELHGHFVETTVVDADAVEALLADGWHRTPTEAGETHALAEAERALAAQRVAPTPAPPPLMVDAIGEDAPPTRAELEQKATELGIKFDGRTRDRALAQKIEEALNPKG